MTASDGNGQTLYPSRTRDRHARANKDYRGNGLALGPEKLRTDAQWITHVTTEEERAGQTYPKSVPSGRGALQKRIALVCPPLFPHYLLAITRAAAANMRFP